ncbi:MAG: hypothetical protein HKN68_18095 [Saprospiraceae bacterium]|nr:hypothetical protein [Saprospiraceae bacterium]
MNPLNKFKYNVIVLILILMAMSCNTGKELDNSQFTQVAVARPGGGSSGMEQIDDCTYLVVYDLKSYIDGYRMSMINVEDESLNVLPIAITSWDEDGISSDLESICSVPGKAHEFLAAESGNWQGNLGRVFHFKVDTASLEATLVGSIQLPMQDRNDFGVTGDQYEAILCLPYDTDRRIVVLGERGGSTANPHGIIRWGILDLNNHTFNMSGAGLQGKEVNVPGNWNDPLTKRDITDFHLDENGEIWAAASEDQGDSGPFYSIVYKLGKVNTTDKKNPITIYESIETTKEIYGFKIEALSGACEGINSTHCFGTEDEIYGGVWRPLNMNEGH